MNIKMPATLTGEDIGMAKNVRCGPSAPPLGCWAAQRPSSPAAESRSEERAEAVGGQVQCRVRLRLPLEEKALERVSRKSNPAPSL